MSKAKNKGKIVLLHWCLAIACLFSLSSCSTVKPRFEPGTLRMNLGTEPPSLDWSISTDAASFDVDCNLMVGLTQYTNDLRCVSGCAKSWEILDRGHRYLFHLRPDVYWSDGKRVVASDFEYSWKRLLNPSTGAQYAYFLYDLQNAQQYNSGAVNDPDKVGVHALDDETLEVKLEHPAAYFIYLTAFCPTLPQRKDVIERWGDRWTEPEHFVCNGPFLLSKWEHEYKIELVSNPRFFEGEPRLKYIKMFMVPEQSTAFALYENDELDYIDNRSFSTPDIDRLKASSEYHNFALLRNSYLGFNAKQHPFDDVRVRQAVSMSIDRTMFPRLLRRGEKPSMSWLPPNLLGWSADSCVKYNPVRARQLLAQAGYPQGKGLPPIDFYYVQREDTRILVEAVQDQLRQNLNMNLNLVGQEWKVYLQTLHRNPPQLFGLSWGADYPDPETFMNVFTSHSGNNTTNWSSSTYDQLIAAAEAEQDRTKRGQLYARADKLLCVEQAAIAPLYLATQNIMVKPWVKGMEFNPLDIQFFKSVTVDNEGTP
jgi:oligopeptide transport system substrate-binding protein